MRIKAHHRRDFWAYVRWARMTRDFIPWRAQTFERGSDDTIRCFVAADAAGRLDVRPREPRLLKLALEGKKLLNWQIKEWSAGAMDMVSLGGAHGIAIAAMEIDELRTAYGWLPAWTWDAVHSSVGKLARASA